MIHLPCLFSLAVYRSSWISSCLPNIFICLTEFSANCELLSFDSTLFLTNQFIESCILTFRFSLLNLLLRPLTEFLLLKALKDRDNVNHDYQSANNAAVPNPIPSSRLAFHDMPPPAHETHLRDSAISQASYQSEMGTPPPQYQQIQTGPKY